MQTTKVPLVAMRRLDEPRTVTVVAVVPNRGLLGPAFKKNQAVIIETLEAKTDCEKREIEAALESQGDYMLEVPSSGDKYRLTRPMVKFEETQQKSQHRDLRCHGPPLSQYLRRHTFRL